MTKDPHGGAAPPASSGETPGDETEGVTVGDFSIVLRQHPGGSRGEKTSRVLDINFEGVEWDKIFFVVLGCPTVEDVPQLEGEELAAWDARYKGAFQGAIPDYPLLGRIWDMYVDAAYAPEEVEQLRRECLSVQARAEDPLALRGLDKLIRACDEALKDGLGVFLAAD